MAGTYPAFTVLEERQLFAESLSALALKPMRAWEQLFEAYKAAYPEKAAALVATSKVNCQKAMMRASN